MAEKTPAKWLQEALITILADGASDLKVDARAVAIHSHLPDHTFTQKAMPAVVVEMPELEEEGPWGGSLERRVYNVTLGLVDGVGVGPGSRHETWERLGLLKEKVKALLREEENRHLGLAWLHVFASMIEWSEGEPEEMGNNLLVRPVVLAVPMVVDLAEGLEGPTTP